VARFICKVEGCHSTVSGTEIAYYTHLQRVHPDLYRGFVTVYFDRGTERIIGVSKTGTKILAEVSPFER